MIDIIPTRLADGGSVELQGMSKRARGERLRPLTTGSMLLDYAPLMWQVPLK